ncbi:MAG: Uma2 family endonuclease [Polyangiaceae bacterium]
MADPARKRATYADVLNAPAHRVAEIVNGDLRLSPRPALLEAAALTALGDELGPPFRRGVGGPGGWILLDRPELHLGADVLVPDIASWRRERLPIIPAEPYLSLAPDWLCEVLSPSTAKLDRAEKLPIYAREGVRHVWLVDPLARLLEVLRLEGEHWTLLGAYSDSAKVRAEPFEVFELELGVLWADSEPVNG